MANYQCKVCDGENIHGELHTCRSCWNAVIALPLSRQTPGSCAGCLTSITEKFVCRVCFDFWWLMNNVDVSGPPNLYVAPIIPVPTVPIHCVSKCAGCKNYWNYAGGPTCGWCGLQNPSNSTHSISELIQISACHCGAPWGPDKPGGSRSCQNPIYLHCVRTVDWITAFGPIVSITIGPAIQLAQSSPTAPAHALITSGRTSTMAQAPFPFGNSYPWGDPEVPLSSSALSQPKRSICISCDVELSATLDAYYGRDLTEQLKCVKCRDDRKKTKI